MTTRRKLNGAEVGKLFIRDLLAEWEEALADKNVREGNRYKGLVTPAEKERLVKDLITDNDVALYHLYRRIHDTVMTLPNRFIAQREMLENRYWQAFYIISRILRAEAAHNEYCRRPRILTARQRTAALKRNELPYRYGIAILSDPPVEVSADKKHIGPPAEFLEFGIKDEPHQYALAYRTLWVEISRHLSECFAAMEASNIIAEAIGMPEVQKTVSKFQEIDLVMMVIERLNTGIKELERETTRYDIHGNIDLEETETARANVRRYFRPIDIEAAKPTAENIAKGRAIIMENISNIFLKTDALHRTIRGLLQ